MSKVKGPFAPIRLGLLEHMCGIRPMECKVYLTAHLMAKRKGPDRGKVFASVNKLAELTGHKWEHVNRSVKSLEKKDYLKPIEGGWLILNFNGDNPANTVIPKRDTTKRDTPKRDIPKGDKNYPEKGEGSIPKRDRQLSQKGIDESRKQKKAKPVTPPLDDINDKKDVDDKDPVREGARKPNDPVKDLGEEIIPEGVYWNPDDGVHFTTEWHEYLSGYLSRYSNALDESAKTNLGTWLTREEGQDVLEYLNERLLTDPRLRATEKSNEAKWKQFRALVRNQFVRALMQKRKRERSKKTNPARAGPAEPKSWGTLRRRIEERSKEKQKGLIHGDERRD